MDTTNYKAYSILLFIFGLVVIGIGTAHTVIDYLDYGIHEEYSAPFYVNILIKSLTYGTVITASMVYSYKFSIKENNKY